MKSNPRILVIRLSSVGDILLATPVAHIWYTRRIPSHMSILLDISKRNLDRILYFAQYVVTSVDEDARQQMIAYLSQPRAEEEG